MKKSLTLLVGILVVAVLLVYMFTYTVRYDEVAVLTTFDSAVEPAKDEGTGQVLLDPNTGEPVDLGSLKVEPGLYFKAPWPIQKVYTYSKQINLLEDRPQEIQLDDGSTVIVKMYLAWRVDDPYTFFRSLKNTENAQEALTTQLRGLTSVVSNYAFDELVNNDPSRLKLREIEDRAAAELRENLARINPGYGIAVEQVGLSRIILPESTTEKVFERMRKTRERMAEAARAEGKSQAATITSRAQSAQKRILAFAERRAQAIRDEGNREAAQYFTAFAEDQDFAVFLRQVEALQEMLRNNTTFVLDANRLWFLAPLQGDLQQPVTQPVETSAQRPE